MFDDAWSRQKGMQWKISRDASSTLKNLRCFPHKQKKYWKGRWEYDTWKVLSSLNECVTVSIWLYCHSNSNSEKTDNNSGPKFKSIKCTIYRSSQVHCAFYSPTFSVFFWVNLVYLLTMHSPQSTCAHAPKQQYNLFLEKLIKQQ